MFRIVFLLVSFILLSYRGETQRFSLIAEVGGMKTQVDGDKTQGFHYNGFTTGIGTYYAFNLEHYVAVKTNFYKQGSRRKSNAQLRPREGFQLELDFNTVGLELSYKYDPKDKNWFTGAGFVRHQIINFEYEVRESFNEQDEPFILNTEDLSSGYISFKFYYGLEVFKKAGVYLAFESAITDMLEPTVTELKTLTPYSISAIFTYEILASKVDERKKRPGTKARAR